MCWVKTSSGPTLRRSPSEPGLNLTHCTYTYIYTYTPASTSLNATRHTSTTLTPHAEQHAWCFSQSHRTLGRVRVADQTSPSYPIDTASTDEGPGSQPLLRSRGLGGVPLGVAVCVARLAEVRA